MAIQRQRPINRTLCTALLVERCPLLIAFSNVRSLGDAGQRLRGAVIVAFLNHKGGVDKTTLALQLAGAWAAQRKRIVVVDTDSQGSALDWPEQRTKEGMPRLFDVLEFAHGPLHAEAARDAHHVVIDGSSHSAALMRPATRAADLALVPAQPSPFDSWASSGTLRLLHEARHFRPHLIARFVLNRCVTCSLIASQIAEASTKHDPPGLTALVGRRVAFADAARTGRLVSEMPRSELATGGRCARRRDRTDCAMTNGDPKCTVTSRPRDADTWIRSPGPTPSRNGAKSHYFTARLTIDVTPDLRGRSQPSGAESPSPKCCAICSLANFLPIPGAPHE